MAKYSDPKPGSKDIIPDRIIKGKGKASFNIQTQGMRRPSEQQYCNELIETNLVETVSKTSLDEQLMRCIESLISADDFDVDYRVAPFRHVSNNPNIVSLYLTAFVIETLINHKDVVDIYGSDDEIYSCINNQVQKYISL